VQIRKLKELYNMLPQRIIVWKLYAVFESNST